MFVDCFLGEAEFSSSRVALTWKLVGTKYNRLYFLLQASTPRTKDSDYSLLPTPTTIEPTSNCEVNEAGRRVTGDEPRSLNIGRMAGMGMLPTPVAWDGNGGGARKVHANGRANELGYSLTLKDRAKAGMLPTPTRFDYNSARTPEKWEEDKEAYAKKGVNLQMSLRQQARLKMLPTPTASSDPKGGCTRPDPKRQNDTLAHAMHDPSRGKTSQLNPRFVEEMMGFPKGWTESPFLNGAKNH
jgi:hypothetical protein